MSNEEQKPEPEQQKNGEQDRGVAQRIMAWNRMATPLVGLLSCRVCLKDTGIHVAGCCRECFLAGREQEAGQPRIPSADISMRCGFCGRTPRPQGTGVDTPESRTTLREGETLFPGTARPGTVICSSCACAIAGCAGARNDEQARRMMAAASLQGEAINACKSMMEHSNALAKQAETAGVNTDQLVNDSFTLSQAAELLSRIAFGGKP